MSDTPVNLILGLEDQNRVVIVEDVGRASDVSALMALAPDLASPDAALELARAVNHFAQGSGFSVIEDPAAYKAWYEAKLAEEDPSAPWNDAVIRLRDHGVPDFNTISAPEIAGGNLVFFAQDDLIGLPYKVQLPLGRAAEAQDYEALTLTPLPSAPTAEIERDQAIAPPSGDASFSNADDEDDGMPESFPGDTK